MPTLAPGRRLTWPWLKNSRAPEHMSSRASACLLWAMYLHGEKGRAGQVRDLTGRRSTATQTHRGGFGDQIPKIRHPSRKRAPAPHTPPLRTERSWASGPEGSSRSCPRPPSVRLGAGAHGPARPPTRRPGAAAATSDDRVPGTLSAQTGQEPEAEPPCSWAGVSAEGPARGRGPLPASSTGLAVVRGSENRARATCWGRGLPGWPLHPDHFPPGTFLTRDGSWEKPASRTADRREPDRQLGTHGTGRMLRPRQVRWTFRGAGPGPS